MDDWATITVEAAGTPPGPAGFVIVALLSIAVPIAVPPAIVVDTTIAVVPLAATEALETVSVWPPKEHVAPAGQLTTERLVSVAGNVSDTETPDTATPPVSMSVIVYCIVSPGFWSPPFMSCHVFVDVERFEVITVVISFAVLFAATLSKVGFETVAVFVALGYAAAPTETVRVMEGAVAPFVSGPGRVQVTACPAAPQVQPVPEALT
jgi:hypothetical protein